MQSVGIFQYKMCPISRIILSANYAVSRDVPVQNVSNQQGYLSANYAVSRDVPVQNVSNQQDYFEPGKGR